MNLLDELAMKYATDKATHATDGTIQHGYTLLYDRLLSATRCEVRRVLEIGISGGASLRMWEEYFPLARILGIDNNCQQVTTPRIDSIIADQGDFRRMRQIGIEHGPFDLVVDDGGHNSRLHVISFGALWPHVRRGGYYAIEDVDVAPETMALFEDDPRCIVNDLGLIVLLKP